MYFWNINKLKEELKTETLTQFDNFKYLLAYIIAISLFTMIPTPINNLWDIVINISVLIITIVGVYCTYRSNNGLSGKNYLQRFFALNWVFGIRFIVFFMLIGIPLCFLLVFIGLVDLNKSNLVDVIVVAISEIIFYWRLSFHFKDVANKST